MKKLIILLLLWPLILQAVTTSYTSFDGTQFVTNGPGTPISVKNGVPLTNTALNGATDLEGNMFIPLAPANKIWYGPNNLTAGLALADLFDVTNAVVGSARFLTNITVWSSNNGPALSFNYVTNGNAQTWMYYPTTNGVQSWYWYTFPSYFFGHNDQVTLMGYGMNAGGGQLVAGQMGLYDQWEPDYYTDATFHQAERHMDWITTNGSVRRPFMFNGRMDGLLTLMLEGDIFNIYGDASHNTTVIGITSTNTLTFNAATEIHDNATNGVTIGSRDTNHAGLVTLISGYGGTNYTAQLAVIGASNQITGNTYPGATLISGANGILFRDNLGFSEIRNGRLNLTQSGVTAAGGITNSLGTNSLTRTYVSAPLDVAGNLNVTTGGATIGGATTIAGLTAGPLWLSSYTAASGGWGGPSLWFSGENITGGGNFVGIGPTTGNNADGRLAVGPIRVNSGPNWVVPPFNSLWMTFDIMGTNIVWRDQIVSNSVTSVTGQFNGNGAGLTNVPPAAITGRSYVQTNFVLNTVYAAPNGPFTTVSGTAILTAAAAVGNVELDVMYQAGGSGAYTAISAPNITTTALSIVMPYQIPFSATFTNGNYYLTNATTTVGGSAALKSGTGTLTTF